MEYLNRTADEMLQDLLDAFGAVLIEGPKWCGKTTTAEQIVKSVIKLQDTDMRDEYLATAASKPSLLLQGETPRLIDEWQDAPVLWDAVRTMVDKRTVPGQFVLTGSNISTLAKKTSMLADVVASGDMECSIDTFSDYVDALERLFVIQDIDAWCPAIRSKTVIRSSPKRGFCDPSIAVALMGLTPEALSIQLKTFGFIFEQMCVRDLKAYTQGLYSHVSYYHDRYDLEADFVLHLEDGRYALIECKLGSNEIEEGAKHLLELKRLIQGHNKTELQVPIREPDLLIILTGGQMAYTRTDGVKIIPLGALQP